MTFFRIRPTVALVFSLSLLPVVSASAQNTNQRPSEAVSPRDQRSQAVIEKAETLYKIGEEELNRGNLEHARRNFDRAVDTALEARAGFQSDPALQAYYRALLDKIQSKQLSSVQDGGAGYTEQDYAPSPIDQINAVDLEELYTASKSQVPINAGDFDFKFEITPPVEQYISYFTDGRGRSTMEAGLRRSGRYRKMAERIFREEGVPLDLIWLAQAESTWKANALSYMSAKGVWQFMPETGAAYGLNQDFWIDERSDPEKATRAAAKYLRSLSDYFGGNWILAMAAYNTGPMNVDRAVQRTGYDDFWEFYRRGFLPRETRNYVPIILATIVVAKDPKKFGFDITPEPEWTYDTAAVPSQTDLRVVSDLLHVSLQELQDYNPELRRSVTPPGSHDLRLPQGAKEQFEIAYNVLPEDQRMRRDIIVPYGERGRRMTVRFATYRVKSGDTLGRLAGRFGVSQRELARANRIGSSARLTPGQTIRIPKKVVGSSYRVRPIKSKRYAAAHVSKHTTKKSSRTATKSRKR